MTTIFGNETRAEINRSDSNWSTTFTNALQIRLQTLALVAPEKGAKRPYYPQKTEQKWTFLPSSSFMHANLKTSKSRMHCDVRGISLHPAHAITAPKKPDNTPKNATQSSNLATRFMLSHDFNRVCRHNWKKLQMIITRTMEELGWITNALQTMTRDTEERFFGL